MAVLELWQRKRNCTRRGVLCGHRRSLGSNGVNSACNYFLDTGQKRGCPAGKKCTRYTPRKCEEKPLNPF